MEEERGKEKGGKDLSKERGRSRGNQKTASLQGRALAFIANRQPVLQARQWQSPEVLKARGRDPGIPDRPCCQGGMSRRTGMGEIFSILAPWDNQATWPLVFIYRWKPWKEPDSSDRQVESGVR